MYDNPLGTDYIFKSTRSNEHISYDSMREILLELAKTVNLPDMNRIGWHSCRKTRADQEFDQTGGDLARVRQILGHTERSKSTRLYLSHPPAPILVNTPEFIVRYKIALLELSNKILERALQLIVGK